MIPLPSQLLTDKNSQRGGETYAMLLDIVLADATALRVTSDAQDTTWNGNTYSAFPFELDDIKEGFVYESRMIKLRVFDPNRSLWTYVADSDGGVDADVTIRFVSLGHLALGDDAVFADFDFKCKRTVMANGWIVFSISPDMPYDRKFPAFSIEYLHCDYEFKGAECGYSGVETTCDHSFTQCLDYGNEVNFGGAPGMGRQGISVYD